MKEIRSCAVILQPELRFIQLKILEGIRSKVPGIVFHGYCTTQQELEFYTPYVKSGLLAGLKNYEKDFRDPPPGPSGEELWLEARDWETKLGTTIGTLAVSHRHFGRGYALGGSGHPRSRMSESFDLAKMTWSYVCAMRFWNKEFADKAFDLVLGGGPLVYLMAKRNKTPYRAMLGSRYENLHFWAEDSHFYSPKIEVAYNAMSAGQSAADFGRPYMVERTHRKIFNRQRSAIGLFKRVAYMIAKRAYGHLRGYEKAKKGYQLADEISFVVREWAETRTMTGRSTIMLDKLRGRDFVFFPLHTEPEASVGQASPEFFFQHAAIAAVSRDLPAGWLLAVKETIHGVGRRPPGFYRQIADLKNVVWLNMDEYGLDVVREAKAVVTITGTAGMEGAVLGKPIIAFGVHNIYNFLPHVWGAASLTDLAGSLQAALSKGFDSRKAQIDGARYLAAIKRTSFDLEDFNYVDHKKFSETAVAAAVASLLETLEIRADHEAGVMIS